MKIFEKLKQNKIQLIETLRFCVWYSLALLCTFSAIMVNFHSDYVEASTTTAQPKKQVIQCIITEGEKTTNVWIELFPNESMIDRYQFLIDGCGSQCKVVRCDSVESFPTK